MTNDTGESEKHYSFVKKVWITAGIISLFIIFFLLFKALFSLLLLVLAAALIAIYFYGFANIIHKKHHLSNGWSLAISIVFNLLLLVGFFWFISARLQQQVSELSDTLPQSIEQAKGKIEQTTIGSKILDFVQSSGNSKKTMTVVKKFFSSSLGILSDLYIILLLAVFFIAKPSVYKKGFIKLLPEKAKRKAEEVIEKINTVLKNWLKGQIFGFFFIAIFTGIALWIMGMPLVLTLALTAGLLNFIPNFGPIIALIPAALIGLTQGTTTTILVVCLYTFIQILQSAVTQPLIQQKMINIPPALIIFAQVAMGLLTGFWGVLLATPIIVIIMTVVNSLHVKDDESLDEIKSS